MEGRRIVNCSSTPNQELAVDKTLAVMRGCFQPRQWFACGSHHFGDPSDRDTFMWVYCASKDGDFQVGYFTPDGAWFIDSSYTTREQAGLRVRYLNGGNSGP